MFQTIHIGGIISWSLTYGVNENKLQIWPSLLGVKCFLFLITIKHFYDWLYFSFLSLLVNMFCHIDITLLLASLLFPGRSAYRRQTTSYYIIKLLYHIILYHQIIPMKPPSLCSTFLDSVHILLQCNLCLVNT